MHIALRLPAGADPGRQRFAAALARVAAAAGHRLTVAAHSGELLEATPDFVLALDADTAKTTPHPTYLVLHGHRDQWLANEGRLANLLTFDGYFALGPLLQLFAKDLLFALRRNAEVGTFGLVAARAGEAGAVPPRTAVLLGDPGPAGDGLRRRLGAAPWCDGPALPEEAEARAVAIRAAGLVVVLQPPEEAAEGLPPPELFEALAAGAAVVAPRSEWLEGCFGGAVPAYDALAAPRVAFEQVAAHVTAMLADPAAAAVAARQAHVIADETLSLEALLPGVAAYHERATARAAAIPVLPELVSVVVRAGGREAALLQRALRSIAAQRGVRVEVVLVLFAHPELAEAAAAALPEEVPLRVVHCPGGIRSTSLWAGFNAAEGAWTAALDDDDEWFPDHLRSVIDTAVRAGKPWAFGGILRHSLEPDTGGEYRRLVLFPLGALPADPADRAAPIGGTTLVFRREMLGVAERVDPGVQTGDDSHLLMALLQQATPPFSARATSVHYEGAHNTLFRSREGRGESILRMRIRALTRTFPPAEASLPLALLRANTDAAVVEASEVVEVGGVAHHRVPASFRARLGDEARWGARPIKLPGASRGGELRVVPPAQPWAYGFQFAPPLHGEGPHLVRLRVRVVQGVAGFGVLTFDERDFLYRTFVRASGDEAVVELPFARPGACGRLVVQAGGESGPVEVLVLGAEVIAAGG